MADNKENKIVDEKANDEVETKVDNKVENKVDKKVENKVDKKSKEKNVKKKQKSAKPNIFVRFGRKCKEVFSELKKVNWPTFGKVLKNTGVVLAVVIIFAAIITAFDFGLLEGIKALVGVGK